MRFILFALTLTGTIADYLQTSLFVTTGCTGTEMQKIFAYTVPCGKLGPSIWGTLSCINSTFANLNAFVNAQCSGTPTVNPLPLQNACTPAGTPLSNIQTCVSGSFSPPVGVISTNYNT